jgi:rRNA maturation endonuclease Nob1
MTDDRVLRCQDCRKVIPFKAYPEGENPLDKCPGCGSTRGFEGPYSTRDESVKPVKVVR